MWLAVAIETVFAQEVLVGCAAGQAFATVGYAGVEGGCVALLA